jgi:S-adenosylmethionine uptake transporter
MLMLAAMVMFTLNDAIGKWLVATYPVGELIAIRSFAALAVLLPLAWRNGDLFRMLSLERPGLQLVRIVLVVVEVACFYWAVRYLPLADVFMFYLASPLFLTAFSVIFLKEKVGARRWAAVTIGFLGVILIFPPSEAIVSLPALIALTGSLSMALMLTLARALRTTGSLTLITSQTIAVAIGGTLTIPMAWVTPDAGDLALLCLLGFIATTAHYLMNKAVTTSPAAVVAPFQYTSIVWAIILGYLIWDDFPSLTALSGATLIVASGLFVLFRERRVH